MAEQGSSKPTDKKQSKEETTEEWKDITEVVRTAVKDMAIGQMIHREGFGLMDAMSALEIMDPKMDSGMNTTPIYNLEERLELGLVPLDKDLTIQQKIGVMDQLMACEFTWISGFTLAQTLFTCLYLHKPSMLEDELLSIYCVSVLKNAEQIRNTVMRADVYEEEDFISHSFNFDFASYTTDVEAFAKLKGLEEKLEEKRKELIINKSDSESINLNNALLSRLKLRRAFYMTSIYMDKADLRGIESAKKSIQLALDQLKVIKETTSLGNIPEGAFDLELARRIQFPSPTRIIPITPIMETIEKLEIMFKQLLTVCDLPNCESLGDIRDSFAQLNGTTEALDVLVRSRLYLTFYNHSQKKILGKFTPIDLVKENMILMGLPSSHVEHSIAKPFLDKVAAVVLQSFKIQCYNRARQRRKIARSFDDWAALQIESIDVDEKINAPVIGPIEPGQSPYIHYFGCWLLELTIQKMISFLKLGFELEIFAPHENGMIFWYLDYVFGSQQQNLLYLRQLEAERKKVAKGKKVKVNKKAPQKIPTPTVYQSMVEVHHLICRGVFRYVFGMSCYLQLKPPTFPFGNDETRFYHRFYPFGKLQQPTPLLYNHFIETTDFKNLTPDHLFSGAVDSFKQAKASIEKLIHSTTTPARYVPELKSLAKVVISNLVQLQLTSSRKEKPVNKVPVYDFSVNNLYPILSLSK